MSNDASEAYEKNIQNILHSGPLYQLFLVAHNTGVLSALEKMVGVPATSAEIARIANLKERYVKELLSGLASGRIVEINSEGDHYWLTKEAGNALAKKELKGLITIVAFMSDMANGVVDDLLHCFQVDGPRGIPYSQYKTFHERLAVVSDAMKLNHLTSDIVPVFPKDLAERLEAGAKSLDVGCGAGRLSVQLGKLYSQSTFEGFDICPDALTQANTLKETEGLQNVKFFEADAANLKNIQDGSYDMVTAFDAIHDQARPDLVLKEVYRVLRRGGYFVVVDINMHSNPAQNVGASSAPLLYSASLFHCMPVSLYFEGGFGLGACWGIEKAKTMVTDVGFEIIKLDELSFNKTNFLFIAKKG